MHDKRTFFTLARGCNNNMHLKGRHGLRDVSRRLGSDEIGVGLRHNHLQTIIQFQFKPISRSEIGKVQGAVHEPMTLAMPLVVPPPPSPQVGGSLPWVGGRRGLCSRRPRGAA